MSELSQKKIKLESLYHYFLQITGEFNPATLNANEELKFLLKKEESLEEIYKQMESQDIFEIMGRNKYLYDAKKAIDLNNFGMIRIIDSDFPNELKKYIGTPPVIYIKGNKKILDMNSIAAVGTRELFEENENDKKAINKAKEFLEDKIKSNCAIVSGLALGCDTIAHKIAIEKGGKTIAVLGAPLNRYYPPENKELQKQMEKTQLVLTQYPFGINVWPNFFAYRNITTVALAKEGILVIKTKEKSGTNYAIKNCVKQHKKLYVIDSEENRKAIESGKILKNYYEINWV